MLWFGQNTAEIQDLETRIESVPPEGSIAPPQEIIGLIGYRAWTALSWALHNQWVQEYKWHWSEKSGKDIGIPTTVSCMLMFGKVEDLTGIYYTPSPDNIAGYSGLLMFSQRVRKEVVGNFYNLMVEGYLTGTDFVSNLRVKIDEQDTNKQEQTGIVKDQHGANQLEGELRRFWAERRGITQPEAISSIMLTPTILSQYCNAKELNPRTQQKLYDKLNL